MGDLNHLYHDLHAPLGKQIAKEVEVALEARAAKGKYPMINEDSTNCSGATQAKTPEVPLGYPSVTTNMAYEHALPTYFTRVVLAVST